MILRFEEISNNAWPALQTVQYDGWLLRFGNGVTKRSNSVSMLYPSVLDPVEKVEFCESLYRSRNIAPCFKVTDCSMPAGIDQVLENKGYHIHSMISFQTIDLASHYAGTGPHASPLPHSGELVRPDNAHIKIKMETRERPGWIGEFIRMNGFDKSRQPTYQAIMQQIMTEKCIVSLVTDKKTIGVGLGVMEAGFVGLFDLVVDPDFRRKGWGRLIVEQILSWGKKNGAQTGYLQVLSNNLPAITLYQKMGFREAYRYWYRVKNL